MSLSRMIPTAIVACIASSPVLAQQIVEVRDGGVITGYVSASGVTRLSFTGDEAASAPMSQGGSGPGFALVHEPSTGDLYLTLARDPRRGESVGAVSFFVTTKAGATYQVELSARDVPSTQIEVRNPELQIRRAERAAASAPFEARIVTLTRAMWSGALADGFDIQRPVQRERAVGSLRFTVQAAYEGADLTGRILTVRNPSRGAVVVTEHLFITPGVLAVALKGSGELGPGESLEVFVIDRGEGGFGG